MKPESILHADILDILFENRNKEYGAYDLRRAYQKRLLKAVMGMLLFVLLIFVWNLWNRNTMIQNAGSIFIPDSTHLTAVDIPKDKPKIPDLPKPVATVRNPPPVIVPDNQADTIQAATVDDLAKDVQIGLQNQPGDSLSNSTGPVPADNSGKGTEPVVEPVKDGPPLVHAENMPEYPGGEKAMQRFLHKNFRFEFEDLQPGSRVEIRCRFVVDKEGNVTGIEIIKSGTQDFDKEVTRVIGKMPKWKPGMQNGRNVAVYFTIPIIVHVPEE